MASPDLNLLRVFVAVVETGGFSAAARRLELPKSTISRSISALESSTGVRLLHRTTRRVAPSTAGAALYERVATKLASLEASFGELPELEEQPSGRLRITAPPDFGTSVLAELLTRFVARYPSLEVDVRVTNELVDLIAAGVDVALRISSSPLRDSSLSVRKLAPIPVQLFAAPSYLQRRGTPRTPAELDEHEWVVFRQGSMNLLGPSGTARVRARGRMTCDDMGFAREAIRAGAGIGILPAFLAGADLVSGRLARILPRWEVANGYLWIVTPSSRHVPRKVAVFRDFVLEATSTLTV